MNPPSNNIGNYGGGFQNAATGSGSQYNNNGPSNGQSIQNIYNNNYQSSSNDHQSDNITKLREEFLRSLSFPRIKDRLYDIEPAYKDTCEWLFETEEFLKWKDRLDVPGNNGVLWIKGKPGAGKSTLMKHTLSYCEREWGADCLVSYFFNARGEILEKTPLGMMRSLVYQLIKRDDTLWKVFLNSFQEKMWTGKEGEWAWKQSEMKEFLRTTIKQRSQPLVLLVDALDECNQQDVRDVVRFLETLSDSAVQGGADLRICLSSRHYPLVSMRKSLELNVDLRSEHERDIATYIRDNLRTKDENIRAQVQNKANGTFMWVTIVVALLNQAHDDGRPETMQEALDKVPKELDGVFRMLLAPEDSTSTEKTTLLFQWVLLSRRPLKPEELYTVVAGKAPSENEDVSRYLNSVSRGLVEIRQGYEPSVQFIHLSVNDFLFRNKRLQTMDSTLGEEPISASHMQLWDCCWTYLKPFTAKCTYRKDRNELCKKHPFLEYASDYIFYHADRAVSQVKAEVWRNVLWRRFIRVFPSSKKFQKQFIKLCLGEQTTWIGRHENSIKFVRSDGNEVVDHGSDMGLLYISSLCGYTNLAREVLKQGADANAQGGKYGNALQAAARYGDKRVINLLLDRGADVNAQGGEYGNALQAAACKGYEKVVKLLLDRGADINAQGDLYGNVLQAVVYFSREKVEKWLLDRGADVNSQSGNYGNALQAAAYEGNEKVIDLLLDRSAAANTQGGNHGTALQAAIYKGCEKVIKLLLDRGADANTQVGFYGNALQAATYEGYDIVKLFLDRGANVNAQGGFYGNALQAAARYGDKRVINLLLDRGADVNAQGGEYGNALQAATAFERNDIVKLLLDRGADFDA